MVWLNHEVCGFPITDALRRFTLHNNDVNVRRDSQYKGQGTKVQSFNFDSFIKDIIKIIILQLKMDSWNEYKNYNWGLTFDVYKIDHTK